MGEGALISFTGRFPSQAHISRTPRLEKLVQKRVAVCFLQGLLGQLFVCTLEGKGAFGWIRGKGVGRWGCWPLQIGRAWSEGQGTEGGADGGCCERLGGAWRPP